MLLITTFAFTQYFQLSKNPQKTILVLFRSQTDESNFYRISRFDKKKQTINTRSKRLFDIAWFSTPQGLRNGLWLVSKRNCFKQLKVFRFSDSLVSGKITFFNELEAANLTFVKLSIFRTLINIYNETFLWKCLTTFSLWLFPQNNVLHRCLIRSSAFWLQDEWESGILLDQ